MSTRFLVSTLALLCLPFLVDAQRFLDTSFSFSKKKPMYITKTDGTEMQCNLKKLKLEKGLVEEIKIEDLSGNKVKIKPEDIKHMYVMPSGFEKVSKTSEFLSNSTMWRSDLDSDRFGLGYVYFEQAQVRIKKKTQTMMLQLVNPHFASKIRVYADPNAKETAGVGVGGIQVTGGLDKSYYVMKDDVAVRLKKKDYDEVFPLYYQGCDAILNQYKKNPDWKDFASHVYTYAEDCE